MILSDRRKPERFPRLFLAGLLMICLAIVAPELWRKARSFFPHPESGLPGLIRCDAEYRRGDAFLNGEFSFGNGNTQSDARAHSGSFSSRLMPADGLQFGMGIRLTGLQPGGLYLASVWRYQHQNGSKGYLAIRSEGGEAPVYRTQDHPHLKEASGWEQIQLQFVLPFNHLPDFVEVYTFSNGKDTVYFDDFEVKLLRTFQESDFETPILDLWLDKDALKRLEEKRTEALRAGLLETGPDDRVKGKLQWRGLEAPVNAQFRLKGDWLDHLNAGKWSFRVELAGNHFWQGMHAFSLQHPATRYYLHEWLLHRLWQQEGVLTTHYDFAEVRLNGQSLGLYAVEEHFEKYLVERQGRREGPILKLDETGFWDGLRHQLALTGEVDPHIQLTTSQPGKAPVAPFSPRKLETNPDLQTMSRHAASLVDQFRSGSRPPSQLFDLNKMARFYAIADVFEAHHSLAWHNLRFYYNPVSDRLEPVGFDGFGTGPSQQGAFLIQGFSSPRTDLPGELHELLFLDTSFVASYLHYLYRYSDPDFLNDFFQSVTEERLPREMILLQEFPEYTFRESDWLQSARARRVPLLPQPAYSFSARKVQGENGQQVWELSNRHLFPLLLCGYAASDRGEWTPLDQALWLPPAPNRPLWMETLRDTSGAWPALDQIRSKAGALSATLDWTPPLPTSVPADAGCLVFQLPGVDTLFRQALKDALPLADRTPRQELLQKPMPHPNGRWVVNQQRFRFLPGRHQIREWLIIPEGYLVEAGPGTILDFTNGAGFLSLSPVGFAGSPEAPVVITSSDGSGKGFTVLAPHTTSSLRNVVFEHLTALQWQNWQQTGAVTFQGATVGLYNCIFRHTRSEDALNLVQCDVDMAHCLFLDTPSDGFDCDFCRGSVRESSFRHCGNDGLDLSGSRLEVEAAELSHCGEKGISIGERSDVALWDSRFEATPTGIAVKDQSVTVADQLSFYRCTTGMAVYQKKPEYGPARLVVRAHQATQTGRLYRVQQGSTLQLGDNLIKGTDQDLME